MPPPPEQKFHLVQTVRRFHELRHSLEASWWSRHRMGDPSFPLTETEYFDLIDLVRRMENLKVKPLSKRALLPILQGYEDQADKLPVRSFGYMNSDTTQRYAMMSEAFDEFAPYAELLLWFYGQPIDHWMFRDMCWRLAAGHERMKAGGRLKRQLPELEMAEHWTGVHVDAVRFGPPTMAKKYGDKVVPGKPQLTLDFRLLGGTFGGLVVSQHIPYNGVIFHLAKNIGFPQFQRTHYNEMVQCVFIGKLTLEGTGRKFLRLSEFFVSNQTRSYNAALRKDRAKDCYRGYAHACHRCPVGYFGSEPCKNATRPLSVVQRDCPKCGKLSVFDPLSKSLECLLCEGIPFKELEKRGQ